MLPAALRRRLDRLNSLPSSFLASQQDQVDPTPFSSQGLICTPDIDLAYYRSNGIPSTNLSSRPTSAGSKGSAISLSADTSGASTPEIERPSALSTYEVGSGLRWNRVVPAFSLLRNAGFEAQQPNSDTRLVRSLFINGLGYLLEALPPDLTADEVRSIHNRLPEPVKVSVEKSTSTTSQRNLATSSSPSYLHRLIAALIVYIFIFIQIILPYIKTFLNSAYTYERKYRITERILAAALKTADGVGKSAHDVSASLSALSEGRIVTAVGNIIVSLMESAAGGVYDGVSEGLVVLGVVRRPSNRLDEQQPP